MREKVLAVYPAELSEHDKADLLVKKIVDAFNRLYERVCSMLSATQTASFVVVC